MDISLLPGLGKVSNAYKSRLSADRSMLDGKTRATAKDQVELSDQARKLKQALKIVAESSAVRADEVSRLAKTIERGCYRVDPAKVADSILTKVQQYRRGV
ncbi:MAG: flagellar biosynthesis anti-sigma factor FlgM [Firmicutes bacterium]|nr:flagellar biosynthesis anti-sigma factor FlgM [Bacillota bacterium]